MINRINNEDGASVGAVQETYGFRTRFRIKNGRREVYKQKTCEIRITADVDGGIIGVTDKERDVMLTLNVKDVAGILEEMFRIHKENEELKAETDISPANNQIERSAEHV